MTELTIVAIPRQDDYIWRISSEKVPHLTILYLGDQKLGMESNMAQAFLEHTISTSLKQFGASVIRRGVLGPKDADVVFFDKRDLKNVAKFRDYLLTNRYIKEFYDSTEQYDSWTPHLTLGYPESPAKPDNRDYPGTSWVYFDRIALWTGDYQGTEYSLKTYADDFELDSDLAEVSMSEIRHYGIPGMKWGVRRSRAELARKRTEPSSDYKKSRSLKKNPRKTLSNKELNTVIKRLELEKKIGELDKGAIDKGHDKVKKYLAIATTVSTAYALSQSPMGKAVRAKLKK